MTKYANVILKHMLYDLSFIILIFDILKILPFAILHLTGGNSELGNPGGISPVGKSLLWF